MLVLFQYLVCSLFSISVAKSERHIYIKRTNILLNSINSNQIILTEPDHISTHTYVEYSVLTHISVQYT